MGKDASALDAVSFFGIRHHGPGSAASLVRALDEQKPVAVLIEGPADASALLPMLASPAMKPPVALLCYPEDDPSQASFWPFAEFSPEYQATLWAMANGVPVEFIDLPSTARFVEKPAKPTDASPPAETVETAAEMVETAAETAETAEAAAQEPEAPAAALPPALPPEFRDPVGVLAEAAGYEDGESWWADLIEQNPAPGPIFSAIADAMNALRADLAHLPEFEAKREAHMRLAIAAARKRHEGPLAVVCGAWHVPALQGAVAQKDDRALLKGLPRKKAAMTWAPWTMPRLAFAHGYGAGVDAPGWCAHVWHTRARRDGASRWLTRIAYILREKGHLVSTAALIEAERLALALAAIRSRPGAGFEELREAAVACLFGGEALLWKTIEDTLLLGNEVGEIPADAPLAPLIEDLQRHQKAARLKPEALERELAIDLRSESGLFRSTLLHRLLVLGVPWGRLLDKGGSRGTFRERWMLAWEPEYAVQLVEKLVYGATIEQAASAYLAEQLGQAAALDALAELIRTAITASLPVAASRGLALFEERAARSSNCPEMLAAIPPLADIVRYGDARVSASTSSSASTSGLGQLGVLLQRLIVEAAINLPHAARELDAEAAGEMTERISAAHAGIRLIEAPQDILEAWFRGLEAVLGDARATPRVAGRAAHILYEAEALAADEAVTLLERRLSPGTPVVDAAGFLEGFFSASAMRLAHDEGLRRAVDGWLTGLDEDDFTAHLPLLRRVFSGLDSMERKRLLAAALGRGPSLPAHLVPAPDGGAGWQAHLNILHPLLTGNNADG
ncbi:MAG: DUF5682 family protein [Candidatus Accumulibacter sp.]|jgi:hypothetical protein|nr:DUF5682 family protein [Accumulibacter sp.]